MVRKQLEQNFEWVDKQVYRENSSLWLPNSFKYDWEQQKYLNRFYECSPDLFEQCLVNNTSNCIEFVESIALTNPLYYNLTTNIKLSKYTNLNLSTDDYTIVEGPTNTSVRFNSPYICPSNNLIVHESNNATIFTKQINNINQTIFKCYSDKCNHNEHILDSTVDETPYI